MTKLQKPDIETDSFGDFRSDVRTDKGFREETSNHWTHLVGVVFALSCIWTVWPAA